MYASKVQFSSLIHIAFEIVASLQNIIYSITKLYIILGTTVYNIALGKRRTRVFLFINYI